MYMKYLFFKQPTTGWNTGGTKSIQYTSANATNDSKAFVSDTPGFCLTHHRLAVSPKVMENEPLKITVTVVQYCF